MQVGIVKLVSGESLVSEIIEHDSDSISVKNPCHFNGEQFLPFEPMTETKDFKFPMHCVMGIYRPFENLAKGYEDAFNESLIQTPHGVSGIIV